MQSDPRELHATEKLIKLDKVQTDRRTQMRVRTCHERVEVLVEVLKQKKDFDSFIELYYDGSVYWIGDGFHRVAAYLREGRDKIRALVRDGGWLLAATHAMGANDAHGLPRTRKDLQHAILQAFKLYPKAADRVIARICHTTHPTVAKHRPASADTDRREYEDKYGNQTTMQRRGKTSTIFTGGLVSTFHQLPQAVRGTLLDTLGEIGKLTKREYAFVREWFKGSLPESPRAALDLRTQLEIEAQGAEEGEEAEELADLES